MFVSLPHQRQRRFVGQIERLQRHVQVGDFGRHTHQRANLARMTWRANDHILTEMSGIIGQLGIHGGINLRGREQRILEYAQTGVGA